MIKTLVFLMLSIFLFGSGSVSAEPIKHDSWQDIQTLNAPTARHEASMVAAMGKLYLLGGRRINPVDQYDPSTKSWAELAAPPIEIHHFQAVNVDDVIYILGAFTGQWPNETPVARVIKYFPSENKFEYGDSIPEARRRGAAGSVYHKGKIYLIGGITDGHMSGYRPWLDAYDPHTGEWQILADAPHARDHFQAAVAGNKLYAIAGRHSSQATDQGFELTVSEVDVYSFESNTWATLPQTANLPTERAGNMAISWQDKVIVVGGESGSQVAAHDEVEVFDPKTGQWQIWPSLVQGRHGSGISIIDHQLFTASGCGNRGGEPELYSIETLDLSLIESEE